MPDSVTPHPAPPDARTKPRSRLGTLLPIGLLVLVILGAVAWGIIGRIEASADLQRVTDDQAIPTVAVVPAALGPSGEDLILPGTVQAHTDAAVYARTSGYLKKWYADIGTPVTEGQVLADIDTPEIDDQLRQAEADLATAEANASLALSTAKRWKALLLTDSVSKQETDEKVGDAAAKTAMVASARANVARLRQLESFKHVVAPFDGVVTARETDIGALINAGSGVGPELFRIADKRTLRIYVQIPQIYASVVTAGTPVELAFAEHPGRMFQAKMVRSSQALDPTARTLLVELAYDNADGLLLPGGFTEVHIKAKAGDPAIRLPVSALMFRSEGPTVATVESDGRASLHKVSLGRDFGSQIEILTGIAAGQSIIVNPPDSLEQNEQVRIANAEPHKPGTDAR